MSRFPTPGPPGVVGEAEPAHHPVQAQEPRRADRQGQPLPQGHPRRGRRRAARTATFLGERYRRIVRRRGKLKALIAIARTILVIIWHLLASRTARFRELGAGYYTSRIDKDHKGP